MSTRPVRRESLSPATLLPAALLVGFALTATAAVRLAGIPAAASPAAFRAERQVTAVATRRLLFADRADGAVVVTDAGTGRVADVIRAGEKTGFVRGVMRGLARDRHLRGIGAATPFVLTAWRDGELSLTDAATGRAIELSAFGPTNRAAFAAMLGGRGA